MHFRLILALAALAALTGLVGSAAADVETAHAALRSEQVVRAFKYDGAADVQWTIGVLNDGRPRYAYASYLCELLKRHGVVTSKTVVRIVDAAKVEAGVSFRSASLGRVNCTTLRLSVP